MTGSPRAQAELQRTLDRLVARPSIGHAVVAVESEDGSSRWVGAAGDADGAGAAMDGQTPFYLASVTKTYTAVLVLRFVEQDRLALDEPITGYLHSPLTDGIHQHGGVDYSGRITIRHLLSNTSGLANYFEDRPEGEQSLSTKLFTEGDRSWTAQDVVGMVREKLKRFFAPGQGLRYSEPNFQLLEAIVEQVTGSPFHKSAPFGGH